VALLCWASAFPAIRLCVRHFSPGELALGRFLTASLVVAPALFFSRPRLPRLRDAGWFFLLGFLGYFVYHVCLNFGETAVTAGAASFLINTAPVWASLLAVAFLGERLGARGWIGIGVSFVGALLIAASSAEGFGLRPEALLILLAAVSAAIYLVLQKKLLDRYRPLELTAYSMWAGTLLLMVFAPRLPAQVSAAPLGANLALIYLGVFPGALAYVIYAFALARLPATRLASFLYAVSPLTVVISWLWLGEVPPTFALLGGALALAGVALVNAPARKQTSL